jgi:hypothetical protein
MTINIESLYIQSLLNLNLSKKIATIITKVLMFMLQLNLVVDEFFLVIMTTTQCNQKRT